MREGNPGSRNITQGNQTLWMPALGFPAEGFSPMCAFSKVQWDLLGRQTSQSPSAQWVKGRKQ